MLERIHLQILKDVNQLGTLTEAAAKLCLTQSALSHSIKKLEQQLGVSLWEKQGRTLQLTQAGLYLLSTAQRILPQLEHAESVIQQFAHGQKGTLRIGMECHPCYQWLLNVIPQFLQQWKEVDVDVKQAFQFGGLAALENHDIDLLITPDPVFKPDLCFESVFDYEMVLVVSKNHILAQKLLLNPYDLINETLITYPVSRERLDIFNQFLIPSNIEPKEHKHIEATGIMMEMVAAGRGVTALPQWLVAQYAEKMEIQPLRLGEQGIHKKIFMGIRLEDKEIEYIKGFSQLARAN